MSEAVTVHVYKASSYHREYTFIFENDPGQDGVEEFLRSFEGDIYIADRFPLFVNTVLKDFKGTPGDTVLGFDLTMVGGKVIPAGTSIIFKTYTDILWSPAENEDEQEYEN